MHQLPDDCFPDSCFRPLSQLSMLLSPKFAPLKTKTAWVYSLRKQRDSNPQYAINVLTLFKSVPSSSRITSKVVVMEGFEPPTSSVSAMRSNQLNYMTIFVMSRVALAPSHIEVYILCESQPLFMGIVETGVGFEPTCAYADGFADHSFQPDSGNPSKNPIRQRTLKTQKNPISFGIGSLFSFCVLVILLCFHFDPEQTRSLGKYYFCLRNMYLSHCDLMSFQKYR